MTFRSVHLGKKRVRSLMRLQFHRRASIPVVFSRIRLRHTRSVSATAKRASPKVRFFRHKLSYFDSNWQ